MSQLFSKIKVGNSSRSTFDLHHNHVTTSDFGYIVPIFHKDMVPNDDFVVTPDIFTRLAPLAFPTFTPSPVKIRIHHFFVPYRILYPDWDAFITQDESSETIPPYFLTSDLGHYLDLDPAVKNIDVPGFPRGYYSRLLSNFGIDPRIARGQDFQSARPRLSAFPFLAYYRIWMDYFMDTNLYSHPTYVAEFNDLLRYGGAIPASWVEKLLRTRNCCYKKDYFTSAKVNPQKGAASRVGVDTVGADLNPGFAGTGTVIRTSTDGNKVYRGTTSSSAPANANSKIGVFTIEALRAAASAQRYSERSNYVGSKLINQLLAHFGVQPKAERIDMSEFLGGFSVPVTIGDVTSHATASDSQTLTSFGLGLQAGKAFASSDPKNPQSCRYHATEHGIFMTVMSILPDTGYYQGISRFWFKGVNGDPLDFYTPEFENLGFQAILNSEIYMPRDASAEQYQGYNADGVFGYQPMYSEYKFSMDTLAGDFVANDTNGSVGSPLDSFHMFRKLVFDDNSPLALNANFVELDNHNNNYDRIFQVTDNELDHFYFSCRVDCKGTRPMVGFAEPSLDSTINQGDGNVINLPYGGTRL